MKKKLRVKVYGKVQGVFFRAFVRDQAKRLNLVGWIKNEDDCTVLLEVEGEVERLEDLLQQCNNGSTASEVEKIEHEFFDDLQEYKDFKILL